MALLHEDHGDESAPSIEYFMQSILRGDVTAIEALIRDKRVNVDKLYKGGVTPLGLALVRGDEEMVGCLLHHGANPNLSCPEYRDSGWCLTSNAVCRMYPLDLALKTENCAIIERLIAAGGLPVKNRGGLKGMASFAVKCRSKFLLESVTKALKEEDHEFTRMDWNEALAVAIAQRDQTFVSLLLENGANPNALYEGLLPLTRAASIGDKVICFTLIKGGAYLDHNQMASSLGQSATPLSCAIQMGLYNAISTLIELGCSVDTSIDWSIPGTCGGQSLASGSSLLHIAAWKRNRTVAKTLVHAGCCLNPQNSELMTPLHVAALDPQAIEILKFLLSLVISPIVTELPTPNSRKKSPFGKKTQPGRGFRRNISYDASHSNYSSNLASEGFNKNFSRSRSLESANNYSLNRNCTTSCSQFCTAAAAPHIQAHPMYEIAINARDKYGRTPLMLAIERKNAEAVQVLLKHDANHEVKDIHNWTALHYAAKSGSDCLVQTLLDAGCKVDPVTKNHSTALQVAVIEGDSLICDILIEAGADLNVLGANRMTLLHLAVTNGHFKVANLLIERKFNVNMRTSKKLTPLMLSARVSGADGLQICQLLTKHGAKLDCRDSDQGESALLIATYYGNDKTAIWLLKEGANTYQLDKRQKSAIYWAVFNSQLSTLVYMIFVSRQTTLSDFMKTYPQNSALVTNVEFLSWFTYWCATPRTLKDCCRQRIRRCIISRHNIGISRLLSMFPLPDQMRSYLIYENGGDDVPCFSPDSEDNQNSPAEEDWD